MSTLFHSEGMSEFHKSLRCTAAWVTLDTSVLKDELMCCSCLELLRLNLNPTKEVLDLYFQDAKEVLRLGPHDTKGTLLLLASFLLKTVDDKALTFRRVRIIYGIHISSYELASNLERG